MPLRLPSPRNLDVTERLMKTRARRVLVGFLIVGLLLATFGFHALVALIGLEPAEPLRLIYDGFVVAAYGLILLVLAYHTRSLHLNPLRVFWWSVLLAVLFSGLWLGLSALLGEEGGFQISEAGYPDTVRTAAKVHLLSGLEAIFAFCLIVLLRVLVLYRRSRASVRNWYIMLGLMILASLGMWSAGPFEGFSVFTQILTIMAGVAMVVNSFRMSWIVFLSFRQKAAIIALCLVLASVIVMALTEENVGIFMMRSVEPFARIHSYALNTFVMLSLVFASVYCTTSFLFMLFHLPTTGDIQKKAGELAAIHSVIRLTGDIFNSQRLFDAITASPIEAGTAQAAWLAVSHPSYGSLRPHLVACRNLDREKIAALVDIDSLYDEVSQRSTSLLLNHASADHRIRARPGDGIESLLVVPLVTRNETVGALFVTKEVSGGFELEDVETTKAFADQAALALDNARLFEERIETARLTRELEIAHQVQRQLLPQRVPVIPGALIAASSVFANEVGGDYYDFVQVDDDQISMIVGDVSGKGTSAAFYMAELKGIFQSLGRLAPSPTAFLTNANGALLQSMDRNAFVSAVYAVLDTKRRCITLARAGHPPAIHCRGHNSAQFVRTRGLGLGLDKGPIFERTLHEECIQLEPGDAFVFYTDGIVESRHQGGEEYGYERLLLTVQRFADQDANQLHQAILEDLHRFLGRESYDDDMTLVVLKWNGYDADVPRATAVSLTVKPHDVRP